MTKDNEDYEICLRADNVVLPKLGHFGISAATGGLADDHDVFHFLTTSLHDVNTFATDPTQINDSDQKKLTQEFDEYQQKLDMQKNEYQKEHPDERKEDSEDGYETDNQRELRQIYESHKQMLNSIRYISQKMDDVVGKQERTLSWLSTDANAVQSQPGVAGNEFGTILSNQNVYMASVREIRAIIDELQTRTDTILQNQARQPTAQIHSAGYDVESIMGEMRDGMNQVKQGIASISNKYGKKKRNC